jgi:hypothetical protein
VAAVAWRPEDVRRLRVQRDVAVLRIMLDPRIAEDVEIEHAIGRNMPGPGCRIVAGACRRLSV